MIRPLLFILALATASSPQAGSLVEPRLTLHATARQQPHAALTLDACSGQADNRILSALIANRIPATVFVTARWLKRNRAALNEMLAHPDLFEIENHGGQHVAAVDHPGLVYGVRAAGSPDAVRKEIADGAAAVTAATGDAPRWYRGATGKYTPTALNLVLQSGEAIAGYSLIADDGAQLSAKGVAARLAKAKDGDVIIAHVNHPEKPAGAGLVAGLLQLKSHGFVFVKLESPRQAEQPSRRGS